MKRISMAVPVFNGNEKKYLDECIETGWVSANGRFVNDFEKKFAEYCGTEYAISCANGTVSLHLALMAIGLKPGDEVIMPSLTYIATANCVKYCGATPVFADSEPATFNVDPADIERKITAKTKAIIAVHLYGLCANMDKINEIAHKHGICVIEDAAEAHGACIGNRKAGSMSDISSFSFFGNKIITSGEGGMVLTNDKNLYEKMKLLKSQGMSPEKRYWHIVIGYNYRMTNMQAAVGLAQLENINWHIDQRKRISDLYKKNLHNFPLISMQECPQDYTHVYWMNNIILSEDVKVSRDEVMAKMEKYNIEMRPLFYPMHTMPPYFDSSVSLPVAERLSSRGISLPSHALLTAEDVEYICNNLKNIIGK